MEDKHNIQVPEEPEGNVVRATDCKCCVCGKPAVAFWPCIDPDIPSNPYCRKCLDDAKWKLIRRICK